MSTLFVFVKICLLFEIISAIIGSNTTTTTSSAPKVVPSVPSMTVVVPQSLLPTQLSTLSGSSNRASGTTSMRSKSSITEEPYSFQKKVYKRVAAGMVWEDPTLADWDPSEFNSLSDFIKLGIG